MSYASVWCNGQYVGGWPYGYASFRLNLTPYVKAGQQNVLAIRLENPDDASRWYPGGGIYRNVWLVKTSPVHISQWGADIRGNSVNTDEAIMEMGVRIENHQESDVQATLQTAIYHQDEHGNPTGDEVARVVDKVIDIKKGSWGTARFNFSVTKPILWDIDSPHCYVAVNRVFVDGKEVETYQTSFGIRTAEFTHDKGFMLNGRKVAIKGVCLHHDLGALGAAFNEVAAERQLRIMKEMGANAVRTSHNPPAPELVTLCDRLGLMMQLELADTWHKGKRKNDYSRLFDDWNEADMRSVVRHYRNHPSVIMWSIGNEVPTQCSPVGYKVAKFLQDICHREDPTRPVTQGMDAPDAVVNNNMAAVMDVAGFNYRPFRYQVNYKKLPQQIILGSETASTVSSRGVYKFPVERKAMAVYDDHQSSSYDVEHCGWSNLPEDDFIQHEDLPYCIGEFVWTGFDYLGEPTPYYTNWPSHSSLFGIIDLAGIPKDRYYLYRSHWNKDEETLHILPHWTWPGREGEVTPIFVYTNYPSAEVFINGKSQGKRTKDLTVTAENSADSASIADFKRQKRYRLMWMDTKYEPGTVKVVAYNEKGDAVAEKEIHTAGKPDHIELVADRNEIKADGKDLSFVTVRVVDKEGNLCPDAQHLIKYAVKGAGTYRAGANGDPTSLELFHVPQMKVFNGMMTAVVQSTDKPGEITLTATGKGLKSGRLVLISK